MSAVIRASDFDLPWARSAVERKRFRSILTVFLSLVLVVGLIIPLITLPEVKREELEKLPPQLAHLVLEKPEIVIPPPPPPPEPVVEKPVEKKPEPIVKKEPLPKPVEKQPTAADAREKAKVSGLLAFQDAFADMREAVDMSKLQDTAAIQRGSGEAATLDRSLITSKQATRSSGVNVAALSRDTGGVALSGRETTKVEAVEGSQGAGGTRAQQQIDHRARSIEDVRRVFDANKGAIFAIYNRALRRDPGLQGQVVLELVIDADGTVVDCSVQSSELTDTQLVAKIVNRIRMFNFGKRDVAETRINYPVHFLPT
ncbi:MAG: AgmX/PglI C-terminal domain-containing protein [Pseudomonadales bacterium]|nr:AgmX/PglI C-terminal domain-containing protein [Pseudomonadales bacterium]